MAFDGRLLAGMSVLAAVVETGSFTRAGDLIGLSASGVSRSVTRLEARIGVRLLDRTTRTLRLTNEGARLYDSARPHLEGIVEAANRVAGTATSVRGSLRAGVNPIFARNVLAPRLPDFLSRYPDLQLTLIHQAEEGDLVAEGLDLAIRFGPQPPSAMSSRLLLETRVLTVASPAYLDRHGRPDSPDMLADHACIDFLDPQSGKPFEWHLVRGRDVLPVKVKRGLTLSDAETMLVACVAGAGIAQVLALGTERLLASGALVDLFPDWAGETFPLYAIRPSRRHPPAKTEAFIDFCVEASRTRQ